ncbi:MAG TPA: nicotinate phosphoribosyltransferase [Thermoanaerobaculia bacterium]|nr:nicotinate phosphoribosyltransferase [Thermoanaerobaculia bacterium]
MSPAGTFGFGDDDLAVATDLYHLTMAAAYHAMEQRAAAAGGAAGAARATFELWVRRLPAERRFLVFAGLEQALAALERLRFTPEHLDYLRGLPAFAGVDPAFFTMLGAFRFRGDVRAMPEGTLFFPDEPVMSVRGTLLEAQVVETLLLTIVNFQSAIASKAARVRLAAGERQVAEFGTRRAHGPQAGAWAARAAWVGGVDSTSNVLAGLRTGMPVTGTMAHSFVMAFEREAEAFRAYQDAFPEHTILLVDTYDTLGGVRRAVETGRPFVGVRLDSGDLAALARGAREILDRHGRRDALVLASGDLDEHRIAELIAAGAPIDAFGVGTRLATSSDHPYLPGIYKLVEIERGGVCRPTFKTSAGKATYPGPKQVVREWEPDGTLAGDRLLRRQDESRFPPESRLLRPVMAGGERIGPAEGAAEARERCRAELARLPPALRRLHGDTAAYPVVVDPALEALLAERRESVLG